MSHSQRFRLAVIPIAREHPARFKRKAPLTVCIAAICNDGTTIFGACDRMLTSGDIEFEVHVDKQGREPKPLFSANPKLFKATSSIVFMTAGDSGLQAELMADTTEEVHGRVQGMTTFLPITDAVDCYVNAYNAAKSKRIHNEALAPFGLDAESFIDRQNEMKSQFIADMNVRIQRADFQFRQAHAVDVIVTGFDETGPHIYVVTGDAVTCWDSMGFAAIGSGARHAESQFMINGHGPYSDREETFLLTYVAKKRSEVAPGVGEGTDMFISEGKGHAIMLDNIPDLDMEHVDKIYRTMEKLQASNFTKAKKETKKYIDAMLAARPKAANPSATDQGQTPAIPGLDDAPAPSSSAPEGA